MTNSITLNAYEAKQALVRLKKTAGMKSTLPILGCALVEATDGVARVTTTNLDASLTWITEGEGQGKLLVPIKLLDQAVGKTTKAKGETLTLTAHDRSVTAIIGKRELQATLDKKRTVDDYPDRFEQIPDDIQPVATLGPQETNALKQFVGGARALDDSRPVLAGIYVEQKGDTLIFGAADGSRMGIMEMLNPGYEDQSFILTMGCIDLLLKDSSLTIYSPVDGHVPHAFNIGEQQFIGTARLIDGTFPDLLQIVPADDQMVASVTVKAEAINDLAAQRAHPPASVIYGGEHPSIQLKNLDDITISYNEDSVSIEGEPVIGDDDKVLAINAEYLRWAVNGDDELEIFINNPEAPTVCRRQEGEAAVTMVIMPMIVNGN